MTRENGALDAELDELVERGGTLYYGMAEELGVLGGDLKQEFDRSNVELPDFCSEYDRWYSVAMRVVEQVIPARLDDFVQQYRLERRKEISYLTYTISDYLLGLRTSRRGETVADRSAALPKFQRQRAILSSAQDVFASSIVDLSQVLQADLFDSELSAAAELGKKGFFRGSGAIAGVVLERHLGHACEAHALRSRKKAPTISDFNEMLKGEKIIDVPKWRLIQHLGDLRNLCCHPKDREPTKGDAAELVEGVSKVIKTVH